MANRECSVSFQQFPSEPRYLALHVWPSISGLTVMAPRGRRGPLLATLTFSLKTLYPIRDKLRTRSVHQIVTGDQYRQEGNDSLILLLSIRSKLCTEDVKHNATRSSNSRQ